MYGWSKQTLCTQFVKKFVAMFIQTWQQGNGRVNFKAQVEDNGVSSFYYWPPLISHYPSSDFSKKLSPHPSSLMNDFGETLIGQCTKTNTRFKFREGLVHVYFERENIQLNSYNNDLLSRNYSYIVLQEVCTLISFLNYMNLFYITSFLHFYRIVITCYRCTSCIKYFCVTNVFILNAHRKTIFCSCSF